MVEATPVVRLNLGVTDTATDKALQAVIVADVQHAVYHEGERAGGASRVIIGRAAYERISGHGNGEPASVDLGLLVGHFRFDPGDAKIVTSEQCAVITRSVEQTSERQPQMLSSKAVFCW